jgi:hypothetical protein
MNLVYYLVLSLSLVERRFEFVSTSEFASIEACHARAEQFARLQMTTPFRISCRGEQRA